MKRLSFLLCWFLTGLSFQAAAGNILGADLTYSIVAPNTYVVSFKLVKDCNTTPAASTYNLQLSSAGCSAPNRTVLLNQLGSARLLTNYCPNTGNICAPFSQPGIALGYIYSAIVNFSPAEQTCSDWNFSLTVPDDTRSASANLAGTPALYLEAFVKLGNNLNNNSVEFSTLHPPFETAIVNATKTYDLDGVEIDGDSVVISLKPALMAAGSPVAYQSNFSAQNPIVSSPAATFNSGTGRFIFTPNVLVPNTLPAQGANRYVAVFQADEYRKINGTTTKIGSVQRDMTFEIREADTTGKAPFFKNFTLNGQPFDHKQVLQILAGQTSTIHFETDDLNQDDNLNYTYWPNSPPYGITTVTNNNNRPQVEIVLTPAANNIQPKPFAYRMKLEDNGCPLKKTIIDSLQIQVIQVSGLRSAIKNETGFTAFPNPFTAEVSFKFNAKSKAGSILIFNLLGQKIDEINLADYELGNQTISWQNAGKYSGGTYIARLLFPDKTFQTIRFMKAE